MQIVKIDDLNAFFLRENGIPQGAYSGINNHEYHALHSYWSSSALKELIQKSPSHFKSKYIDSWPESLDTPAMRIGSAVHALVLEPEMFNREFGVLGFEIDRRTKEGKAAWADFQSSNFGKTLLTFDESKTALSMAHSVLNNSRIKPYIKECLKEVSLFWECPFTGLKFRARPDGFCEDFKIELKTTKTASPFGFTRQISSLNYSLQVAHYAKGLEQVLNLKMGREFFIIVENEAPFVSEIYEVSENMLTLGHEQWLRAATELEAGVKNNHWPTYSRDDEIQMLQPPFWEMREWGLAPGKTMGAGFDIDADLSMEG